ncbi:hypothetical protein C2S51_012416 [Perilla frutescens var. frutescens]|nr:hypothetical protein C2S51_012416 [Perilla frutescens var. frutescens]
METRVSDGGRAERMVEGHDLIRFSISSMPDCELRGNAAVSLYDIVWVFSGGGGYHSHRGGAVDEGEIGIGFLG